MEWIILILFLLIIIGLSNSGNEKRTKRERFTKLRESLAAMENFHVSQKVDGFGGFYTFAIDNDSEKICYISGYYSRIVDYKDIIEVEIIEDGNTISKKSTSRTIGGAILGGILAGGAGSIVGGLSGSSKQKRKVSSLCLKILIRDTKNPTLIIRCFDSKKMTTGNIESLETEGNAESHIYKSAKQQAEKIKDILSVIIDKTDRMGEAGSLPTGHFEHINTSIADEILKLNELRIKGIITDDEFASQKVKVLNKE